MANELTTVFLPIISEARMAEYAPADFHISTRLNDPGIDIQFTPQLGEDQSIFMIAPGVVYFIGAGTTVALVGGPEITAPAGKDVVVMHVLSTYHWAPILATNGQPVAEWWALEGIGASSFEIFLDSNDLEALATQRGYSSGDDLRSAVLSGAAGINVLLADDQPVWLGNFPIAVDDSATVGFRAWASYDAGPSELDAANALATIKQLAPALETHPLLTSVLTDLSASDVTIHVRFVYWKPSEINASSEIDKGTFEPVPANSKISLQKRSAGPVYASLVEETVVDNGLVALTVPRADLVGVDLSVQETLVFQVEFPRGTTFETQYQHERKPRSSPQTMNWGMNIDAWNTFERLTTDGSIASLDFLVDLESSVVGSVDQPLEYYAGIPVFLQIQYPVVYHAGEGKSANFQQEIRKAPKGLRVEILSAGFALGEFRTDEHGQIWGSLLQANETDIALEIRVHFELEDETIGLLPIKGEVLENNLAHYFYESSSDHYTESPFFDRWISSIGKPTGSSTATELATLQVGVVTITNTIGVSSFRSDHGRDAGVVYALQQIRYMHQWFHWLTEGFTWGVAYQSWEAILKRHAGGNGVSSNPAQPNYTISLPYVRVTEPLSGDDEQRMGEVLFQVTPDGAALAWWLVLYGHDRFDMNDKLAGAEVSLPNKVQFWRDHTIWHEFTHTVLNMVLHLAFDMDALIAHSNAKFALTSGRINEPIPDGWSTLEEAIAAIPEVALSSKFSGIDAQYTPNPSASPRYMNIYDRQRNIAVTLNGGMNVPTVLDWRLGLRVPMAFTNGLWYAWQQLAGVDTLYNIFGGPPIGNDLKDTVGYLASNTAKKIFKYLIWGPLVVVSTPQDAGPPGKWDDLNGAIAGFDVGDAQGKGAAGPAFGSAGSRRIRIDGPSTHRFMEVIEQEFWMHFSLGEQNQLRDIFGDVDDDFNLSDVSFYLWFNF